jgi:1,4-dihydroxy-2-naphthoate octaprenyltransferase
VSPNLRRPGLRRDRAQKATAAASPGVESVEPAEGSPGAEESPAAEEAESSRTVEAAEPATEPAAPSPVIAAFAGGLPATAGSVTSDRQTSADLAKEEADLVADALARLAAFPEVVLSWIAEDGYPMNVAVPVEVRPGEGSIRFGDPAGFKVVANGPVALTGSHIRVQGAAGFDQRSHVTVWGTATPRPRGRYVVTAERAWSWSDTDLPLPAAYESRLPKARRYFTALSAAKGYRVRPRLGPRLLLFRATRAPFLSATFVPVLLGLAIAARVGSFDLLSAVLTLAAAAAVHLGLNVANDVFDTLSGADDANRTPTRFSGGSRVIQNALVSVREMSVLALVCYGVAAVLGLVLLAMRGSPALVVIALVGLFISLAYTMPPFAFVYRGIGEVATAIGFGPVMLLGAYVVQTQGAISLEAVAASLPVALLVAMILYVNEIPDRSGDQAAGKLTLPVRWPRDVVIRVFDASVIASFAIVAAGVAAGLLPIPALLALLAIPLARRVHQGIVQFYDNPYGLMAAMAGNIQLHLAVGGLLIVAYLMVVADQQFLGLSPYLW